MLRTKAAARCAVTIPYCLLAALSVEAARAQDDPATTESDDGVVRYEQAFFATFNPVTALDMVNRLPGFSLDNGDNRRGFGGASGNVLINGERPTSKSGVSNILSRIAATNVTRIDLLRGGAANAEAPGQSVVANVVLVEGALAEPTGTWRAQVRSHRGGRISGFATGTYAFAWQGMDISLGATLFDNWAGRSDRDEFLLTPDGDLLFTRDEFGQENYREVGLTLDIRWPASAVDTFTLNAEIEPWIWTFNEQSIVRDPDGTITGFDTGIIEERDNLEGQVGGDWERRFSDALSFKLIGLQTFDIFNGDQLFESFDPGAFEDATRVAIQRDSFESILRGAISYAPNENHAFDFGLEAAFNSQDSQLDVDQDDGSGAGFVAVPLSLADTRVEELRGEAFVTDIWRVSDALTLESGLTFEASRITQTGDAEEERTLTFWKPRFAATYAFDDLTQLRLILERDVAQLDFQEFASSVDVSDDNVDLGNPDLEPERTWSARAEFERRFAERGVVSAEIFYDAVEAVQDVVPIGPPGARFDAPGNLGDGTRYGIVLATDLPLDSIGVPGGLLELDYFLRRSQVDDPVTGEERRFAREPNWQFDVDFRQDIPSWDFAWGFDWHLFGDEFSYRTRELWRFDWDAGDLDAFVETTRFGGVTITAGVDNIFNQTRTRERRFFVDDRASGDLSRIEVQERSNGPLYWLRLSGTF